MNILQAKVLATLRPPSAKRTRVTVSFKREGILNLGLIFQFEPTEPVLAPGGGTVTDVCWQRKRSWQALASARNSYEVVIDHGQAVYTVIAGLGTVNVRAGSVINRGDLLGTLADSECWFGCQLNGNFINSTIISRHFVAAQEKDVPGQSHKLRFAPDTILRNLANCVVRLVYNGIQYFQNVLFNQTLLVSVDFNGGGTKTGSAVVGVAANDYWNVYAAGAFTMDSYTGYNYYSGHYYYYCAGIHFSSNPQVFLFDSTGKKTAVSLERVAAASSASGAASQFDPMLSRYIGGYASGVPEENFFALKGMPAGAYELYLYANEGILPNTTTFYVALNGDVPVAKSTAPTATAAFVENQNYVKYTLAFGSGSYISVKAYGYFAGLQLVKV